MVVVVLLLLMMILLCLKVLLLCFSSLHVGELSGFGHHALLLKKMLLRSKERHVVGKG